MGLISLSSSKRSPNFQVVINISVFALSGESHFSLLSMFSHSLDVNVRNVVNGQVLSLLLVQQLLSFVHDLVHPFAKFVHSVSLTFVVHRSEELVVFFVAV